MMKSQREQRFFIALMYLALVRLVLAEPPSEAIELNRFTFNQNVFTAGNNHVQHWIVRFCHDWYSPCEKISKPFEQLAGEFTNKLNTRSTVVRFANVDCSTNKPLCNGQAVDHFPKVIHYSKQQKVAEWHGGSEEDQRKLERWLTNQFPSSAESEPEPPVTSSYRQQPKVSMTIPDWVPSVPDLHLQEAKELVTKHTGALAKASITLGLAASIVSIGCAIQKEFSSILRGV